MFNLHSSSSVGPYSKIVAWSPLNEAASAAPVIPASDACFLNHARTLEDSTSGAPKYSANLLVVMRRLVNPSRRLLIRPIADNSRT